MIADAAQSAEPASAAAAVQLDGVTHAFGATTVVKDVSLAIGAGEFVALLGPSGCGKSTLLRILAGLQSQTAGSVTIDGVSVDGLSPRSRRVGIVFQNYALFPHMTALANVAYGLEAGGSTRRQARERARELLDLVRIGPLQDRYPRALSGGQQQRVALARTLAVNPRILLLDEPLGALDKNLRLDMQIEIRRLQRSLQITTVMVTHDQEEAMSMADRVAVLNGGVLEQFDTPMALYDRPATPFVAGFVGTSTLMSGILENQGHEHRFTVADGSFALDPLLHATASDATQIAIRPEQWEAVDPAQAPGAPTATVVSMMPLGPSLLIDLELADRRAAKLSVSRGAGTATPAIGSRVALRLKPGTPVRLFH